MWIAFSPDTTLVAAIYRAYRFLTWDIASGTCIKNEEYAQEFEVWSIVFSPDGARLATGGGGVESLAKVWPLGW